MINPIVALYTNVWFFLRALLINKTQPKTNNPKKKNVPAKNGNPKEFLKKTSKDEAKEIEPGITPS